MKIINLELDDNCGRWNDMLRSFFSLFRAGIYGKTWNGEKPSLISVKIIVFFLTATRLVLNLNYRCCSVRKLLKLNRLDLGLENVWMVDVKSCIHDSHNEHHVVWNNRNMLQMIRTFGNSKKVKFTTPWSTWLELKEDGGSETHRRETIMSYEEFSRSWFHLRESSSIEIRKLC